MGKGEGWGCIRGGNKACSHRSARAGNPRGDPAALRKPPQRAGSAGCTSESSRARPQRILDLGSGPGSLWRAVREQLPEDWRIVLADRSLEMLRRSVSEADLPQVAGRARLDAHDLPFADGSFDAALAIGLLDLIPKRARALAEIRRTLAAGGRLYASAGGERHLQELERLLRQIAPSASIGGLTERFGLENGREQLLPWFAQVEQHVFRDALVFEQAEPALDYILSEERLRARLPKHSRDALVRAVERELEAQGSLRVTVEKGLFVAWGKR